MLRKQTKVTGKTGAKSITGSRNKWTKERRQRKNKNKKEER